MNLLILKGFNNYFNRKLKKYSTLADYMNQSSAYYNFGDINFNPNDGVSTSQIVGSENQKEIGGSEPEPLKWEIEGSPDYIIAYETRLEPDPENENLNVRINTIISRWFVMESVRVRDGQYKLALKRDVLADYLRTILRSACFVEKGWVTTDNPLIFNEENVSLNQIKKGETMLTDETGIPWLVMYIAKNYKTDGGGVEQSVPIEGKMTLDTSNVLDYTDLPWSNIENGISQTSTNITRRIAGAGEINISPIVGGYLDYTGVGRYITYPTRANIRHVYSSGSNTWVVDKNTTNITAIDTNITVIVPMIPPVPVTLPVLERKELNLTPASTTVRWGDSNDGRIVSGVYCSDYGSSNLTAPNETVAQKLIDSGGLNSGVISVKNAVISYLNAKKTSLEANVSHMSPQANMEAYVGGNQSFLPASTLLSYNNKIVKSGVNYYRIKIKRQNNYSRPIDYFTLDGNGDIVAEVSRQNNLINNYMLQATMNVDGNTYNKNTSNNLTETYFEHAWFDVQYERVQGDLLRFTLPKPSERVQLNDAAYDMICFPFGAIDFVIPNDGNTQDLSFTSSKEASLGMARSIAAQIGSAMYDMQLLPYCPYRQVAEQYGEDGYINLGLTSQFPYACWSGVYKIATSGDTPLRSNARSFGLWCHSSSGTIDINYVMEGPEYDNPVDYKTFSACKKFRLVAPNYTSVFEFNPLKNNGVTLFNVDFNYRPYNPYIHIAPYFNAEGLYGVDTNDNRGLILQGDFSVGYYSDAWANYQIQNANYANIFNRQLQNIDFNQKQEREKWDVNRITGWVTEGLGLGGGMQGAKAFSGLGPWGMLGGGIGGTVGGLVGQGVGVEYYDRKWMNEAMAEEKSYAIDNYNMALGNVKALPYGLAKSDALNENFKYFPFIEEFNCTKVEEQYFRNKLYYDGMTVGAIDMIENYIPEEDVDEWVKVCGRMIILESLADDFQIANAIYTEVEKGFYYRSSYVNEGD